MDTQTKKGYPEKMDRNKEIFNKKVKGITYRQLSSDYNLSMTTLQKMVKRWANIYPEKWDKRIIK